MAKYKGIKIDPVLSEEEKAKMSVLDYERLLSGIGLKPSTSKDYDNPLWEEEKHRIDLRRSKEKDSSKKTYYLFTSFSKHGFGFNKIQGQLLGYKDDVYPSIYSLSGNELKIFLALTEMMEYNNTVVCSSSDISDVCGIHATAVRNSLQTLQKKKYFVLKIEEIKKRSKYIINPLYYNKGDDRYMKEACNIWNERLALSAPELTHKYKQAKHLESLRANVTQEPPEGYPL